MGRLLIALGVLVIIGGLAWTSQRFRPPQERPAIPKIGPQMGARGLEQLPLPPDEIDRAVAKANDIADAVNASGVASQTWSDRLLLLVICFGGGVSILAGWQKAPNLQPSRKATLVFATAILGAGSAISTSGASHLDGVAEKRFVCVDRIEKAVAQTVGQVRAETDAVVARQHLADMQRDAARCET